MNVLILIFEIVILLVTVTLFVILSKKNSNKANGVDVEDVSKQVSENVILSNERLIKNFGDSTEKAIQLIGENLKDKQQSQQESFEIQIRQLQVALNNEQRTLRETVSEELKSIRADNEKKLSEIRATVDDKLQSTLNTRISESFETVRKSLDSFQGEVVKLGTIASDVGDLKGVLTNVKTRGILGELQLESILEEIIPTQYEKQVATRKGSSEKVDFAVKITNLNGGYQYLPIDSKFPLEKYRALEEAKKRGDKDASERARKELVAQLKQEAKDIKNKYIDPSGATLDFAVMFLPTEGLYTEAVNAGLIEELNKIRVMITGPSTMAAFLNSVRIMLQAVVIGKNSREIYRVFLSVRTEFEKFGEMLDTVEKRLNLVKDGLDELKNKRYDKISAQFKKVDKFDFIEDADLP